MIQSKITALASIAALAAFNVAMRALCILKGHTFVGLQDNLGSCDDESYVCLRCMKMR